MNQVPLDFYWEHYYDFFRLIKVLRGAPMLVKLGLVMIFILFHFKSHHPTTALMIADHMCAPICLST